MAQNPFNIQDTSILIYNGGNSKGGRQVKKVIVIGAGLGGLAAAIMLQSKGAAVTVLDENLHAAGRKMMSINAGGFYFNFGPDIMTMPHVFKEVIRQTGKNPDDYFQFEKVTRHTRNLFPDGSELWQTTDYTDMDIFCFQLLTVAAKKDVNEQVIECISSFRKRDAAGLSRSQKGAVFSELRFPWGRR
ncbi:hypothetical protein BA724_02805 [Domibacillus iocasae]|uniref:Uncharacterized protein n=1 Tax=Domibacillus iocasae TaxID=1714016 RepID=A0A1E7DRP6_9BACI|nr:hypothetical protein BA724_02805 [Domibacillus iocasae]